MAVLVRSAARQVPLLRRALTAAGVPVTVAGDELPLADEPGTRPLLLLLRCALQPAMLDDQTAAELLCGPLGGTDALGLRRLRRSLGLLAEAAGDPGRGAPRQGDLGAGGDPRRGDPGGAATCWPGPCWTRGTWPRCPDSVAAPARHVARLLAVAKAAIKAGGSAEDVLWAIWDASGLAPRWQQAAAAGRRGRRGRGPGPGRRAGPVRQGRALRRHHAAGRTRPVRRTAWPGRRSSATRWPSGPSATTACGC